MTINRLGPVDPLSSYGKAGKTVKVDKKEVSDSINLSQEGLRKAELLHANELAKAAPDIRMDRVAEVSAKLQDPNYINDKVLDDLTNALMESFGI